MNEAERRETVERAERELHLLRRHRGPDAPQTSTNGNVLLDGVWVDDVRVTSAGTIHFVFADAVYYLLDDAAVRMRRVGPGQEGGVHLTAWRDGEIIDSKTLDAIPEFMPEPNPYN
jgi:hypothetical protein